MNKFIVIEGCDYSGKTTIINLLKKDFPNFLFTREPGGSVDGEKIRNVLLSEACKNYLEDETRLKLFFAARMSHLEDLIIPNILQKNVISDRFDASTYAYQVFQNSNSNLNDLFWDLRNRLPIRPNLYIYLDIDYQVAKERIFKEGIKKPNHFDIYSEREFNERRNAYIDFFKNKLSSPFGIVDDDFDKFIIIDAKMDLESVYLKVKGEIGNLTN